MKLSELFDAYGDDIQHQYLDHAAFGLSMANGLTTITFSTDEPVTPKGTVKLGIVVWLDRDRLREIVAAPSLSAGAGGEE